VTPQLTNSIVDDILEQEINHHVAKGDHLGEEGDYQGAVSAYKKAAALAPDAASHWTRMAEAYAAADKPQLALQCYQKVLESGRRSKGPLPTEVVEAHLGLGDMCCSFAMSATAVRSYERAVRSRPDVPFYRWKLASALITLGMYEKAEQQLKKALQLAPQDAFYRFTLADVYLLMRRDKEAITELQQVVKMAKRDIYYHLRLGAALLRNQRADEALPYFERAVELDNEDNESYRVLLRYARQRNHKGAEHHADIAAEVESIELHPYDADFVGRFKLLSQPV
jgi:tetratricopeptide (TPR) repeat protein